MTQRKQAILIFSILMFCYAYVHQGPGWNQNSRLDLLHALFVHQTIKIDAYHENTGDKSIHSGHYYSDKAPGIVFLALPAFTISAGILYLLDVPLDSEKGWLVSDWITTAGSVGLITALGGVAMFLFLCRLVEQRYAFLTTYVVFLGAAPFPYATMLFSHAAVIGLVCIALWAIADQRFFARMTGHVSPVSSLSPAGGGEGQGEEETRWFKRHLLAGVCCGLAISSEYTAAIAAGGVLALALLTNFKRGLILALAAIPPLLLIPIYNWICFGGPLSFGYHHLALEQFQEMNKGLFGITFPPKASAAYLILFSPARGLFFWTPFFLVTFLGLRSLFKASRKFFWVSVIVVIVHVICISGYYMPSGGAALGPRHLAPMLPFMAIFAAFGLERRPSFGGALGLCSVYITGLATLIDAMPLEHIVNPLMEHFLPRLIAGDLSLHVGLYLGLPQYFTVALILIPTVVTYLLTDSMETESRKKSMNRHGQ